jgi:hypothetical protein
MKVEKIAGKPTCFTGINQQGNGAAMPFEYLDKWFGVYELGGRSNFQQIMSAIL